VLFVVTVVAVAFDTRCAHWRCTVPAVEPFTTVPEMRMKTGVPEPAVPKLRPVPLVEVVCKFTLVPDSDPPFAGPTPPHLNVAPDGTVNATATSPAVAPVTLRKTSKVQISLAAMEKER
jgi:hypothetical protein